MTSKPATIRLGTVIASRTLQRGAEKDGAGLIVRPDVAITPHPAFPRGAWWWLFWRAKPVALTRSY